MTKSKRKSRCSSGTSARLMRGYEAIVSEYITGGVDVPSGRMAMRRFLNQYMRLPSLKEATRYATLANHPHQNCLPWWKRREVFNELVTRQADLTRASTFDQLYAIVKSCVRRYFKQANLYIYDLALRIGAYLKRRPTRVYLHQGAMDGAKSILAQTLPDDLPQSAFPKEFRRLRPHELEDCLCIYKDELAALHG